MEQCVIAIDWRDIQERRPQKVTFSLRTKCNLSPDRHGRMYAVASRGPGFHAGVFRFQGVRKSATARHFGLAVESNSPMPKARYKRAALIMTSSLRPSPRRMQPIAGLRARPVPESCPRKPNLWDNSRMRPGRVLTWLRCALLYADSAEAARSQLQPTSPRNVTP